MGVANSRDHKKNGKYIRIGIGYRRVNQLARLMVYPMPLFSKLLQYVDKAMWYCSLEWLVDLGMWIRPNGLGWFLRSLPRPAYLSGWRCRLGWRSPYIFTSDWLKTLCMDTLQSARSWSRSLQVNPSWQTYLRKENGDRSIAIRAGKTILHDDILIPATTWTSLYDKVGRLLSVCDRWNLSIGVAKRFWGRR